METTTALQPGAAEGDPDELSDAAFAWDIGIGALVGIPVTFVVLFLTLLIGTGKAGVAPAVLWAALVGGGYFGGFIALSVTLGRLEAKERAARRQVQARYVIEGRVAHAL